MTRNRKIVLGSVAALLLLFGGAAALIWLACHDDPPPDDAELVFDRPVIPEDQNAFTLFEKANKALFWPGEGEERDLIWQVSSGETWDGDLMEHTLADNAKALDLWKQGMALPQLQVPEIGDVSVSIKYALRWLDLTNCGMLQSRSLFADGREAEAFENDMRLAEFGRRIEHAKGNLTVYLVGSTVRGMALAHLRQLVSETTLGPEALTKYGARLAPAPADDQAMADAYRAEYVAMCGSLRLIAEGRATLTQTQFGGATEIRGNLRSLSERFAIASPYHFKMNRTKALFARDFHLYIELAPKSLAETQSLLKDLKCSVIELEVAIGAQGIAFRPNGTGEAIYCIFMPAMFGAQILDCGTQADLAGTRLVIALKCFEKARGHLPEKLDELVPDFLDAVPADPFDGKPMRWSKERKIVWAVGRDLVDDGGDETLDKKGVAKDVVYHLDPKDAKKDSAERGTRSAE
jgi:hypothetical protein